MKIVVGLGNPGEKYAKVRHNLGFMVVDKLVSSIKYPVLWEEEKKFKSQIARISQDLLVIKPQTYMNNSGMAVALVTKYYKIPAVDLIVIHDELDLPLGKIKVRMGGAAAGHHGVESIIKELGTDQFVRVRLGIGSSAEKFVLEPFIHSERSPVKHMIKQAIKALDLLLEKGLTDAQNQFNS